MIFPKLTVILTLCAMVNLQAQTPTSTPPPPTPVTGPTMEQTIAFINDAFTKQGIVFLDNNNKQTSQSAHLESPCLLAYNSTQYINGTGEPTTLDMWKIDLEKDDPRTLKIYQRSTYYGIQVDRSAYSDVPNLAVAYVGAFRDKSTTERVAKAYIHAMVLCHKPEAPSLF